MSAKQKLKIKFGNHIRNYNIKAKERLEKIEFSIRMLHFHNYINDTQFIKMMDKLNKEIKSIKEKTND